MLALALAARSFTDAGEQAAAELALNEVRAFANRNRAPGLLRLTGTSTPKRAWLVKPR